jgi:hypothetical protein
MTKQQELKKKYIQINKNMDKIKQQPSISSTWEKEIKKVMDQVWENRHNLSINNVDTLRRFANKKR